MSPQTLTQLNTNTFDLVDRLITEGSLKLIIVISVFLWCKSKLTFMSPIISEIHNQNLKSNKQCDIFLEHHYLVVFLNTTSEDIQMFYSKSIELYLK